MLDIFSLCVSFDGCVVEWLCVPGENADEANRLVVVQTEELPSLEVHVLLTLDLVLAVFALHYHAGTSSCLSLSERSSSPTLHSSTTMTLKSLFSAFALA